MLEVINLEIVKLGLELLRRSRIDSELARDLNGLREAIRMYVAEREARECVSRPE